MKKKILDVGQIQRAQREFAAERDWDQFHLPKNLAMALAAEAGELLEVFQWMTEKEALGVADDPVKRTAVEHELSDILYYLFRLADKLDIDLDKAFWEKFEHNRKKYPARLARGNAKKYTELRDK